MQVIAGKISLQNDLFCVMRNVKLYSVIHFAVNVPWIYICCIVLNHLDLLPLAVACSSMSVGHAGTADHFVVSRHL